MSIRVMTLIWDTCLYQAGTLNVLLAMADHASDNGRDIYPGMEYLAAKCRQTVRATQDCVKRLRADRVLILLDRNGCDLEPTENPIGGRGYRATYRIDLQRVQKLQGLHQIEHPECEHCKAGRKTPQDEAEKGEVLRKKGELSRSHIERTVNEPSGNHSPPADAGESDGIASLGNGNPERWPEFRKVVEDTWPGGFPAKNEIAGLKAFVQVTRVHDPELVITCAKLHGKAETASKAGRRGKSTHLIRLPANWLREGDWQGYVPRAAAEVKRETEVVSALGRVQRAVGDGLFALLRREMPDAALAMLDGIGLTQPATITVTGASQRALLERREGKIERLLGERPRYVIVPKAGAA